MPAPIINPTSLNDHSKGLLWKRLTKKENHYEAVDGLTHRLGLESIDPVNNILRYTVYNTGDYLNEGTGYTVYKSQGTLTVNYNKKTIDFKISKNKIYKKPKPPLPSEGSKVKKVDIIDIAPFVKRLPYLHAKNFIKTKDGIAYQERKLGTEFSIYDIQHRSRNLLDLINRAIQLIRALQEVHDVGIIHRDIKDNNTLVKENGTIKIIDFNLAKLGNKAQKRDKTGTFSHVAPEVVLHGVNTEASDAYSLGLILFNMFGGTKRPLDQLRIFSAIQSGRDCIDFATLFADIEDLMASASSADRALIKNTIQRLLTFDPKDRMNLDEALEMFLMIKRELLIPPTSTHPERDAQLNAMLVGSTTHRALSKLKYASTNNLNSLATIIKDALDKISDSSIQHFIAEAGVKAFRGLTTKDEIKTVSDKIMKDYLDNLHTLDTSLITLWTLGKIKGNDPRKETFNDLKSKVLSLASHTIKCTKNLDRLKTYNYKYTNQNLALAQEINQFCHDVLPNQADFPVLKYLKPATNCNEMLKNRVRKAIQAYLQETFSIRNIKNRSRAFNKDRYDVINTIMKELDTNNDMTNLHNKIRTSIDNMKLGFFGRRGSKLYRLIDNELYKDSLANNKKQAKKNFATHIATLTSR